MANLYSYVLRYDNGSAPNPFWGICTLSICKPAIRRTASVGDWVVGTGSANAECHDGQIRDLSSRVVYAMKITKIMSLEKYDEFCREKLSAKIPDIRNTDWRRRVGDCIYDYSGGPIPCLRPGVHFEENIATDLGGKRSLLSTHFYYFGEQTVDLPNYLRPIVLERQNHRKIRDAKLIASFERWIQSYSLNSILGEPMLKHRFVGRISERAFTNCGSCHLQEDENEGEETIC
ncbi:MAG TPA: hypothetical protein VHE34_30985 [Puia sp.]|uniref:Nmad2 family putative nucleotide modification protein n=1 Tax=Puia sp. TaxID=2045100 RepID=UPI002BC2B9C5|nr:hypothetical protein [Puia sp.]HVU99702.1 hypothetical protein [Puia sp.]